MALAATVAAASWQAKGRESIVHGRILGHMKILCKLLHLKISWKITSLK